MTIWKFFRFLTTGAFFLGLKIRGIMMILCMIAFLIVVVKLVALGNGRKPTVFSIVLSCCLCLVFLVLGLSLPDIRIFNVLFY